jgi:urea transport system permease protein
VLFACRRWLLMRTLLLGRYLVTSKFGRVLTAIRDAESRVMFIGYNPLHYKLFIWTLSAMLCGIAGALYVPQVGIINPGEMSPANSIEIAIWVAVGGRGTLIGPVIGAFVVNLAKSFFTVSLPRILAVLPRRAVRRRHALAAGGRGRPVESAGATEGRGAA